MEILAICRNCGETERYNENYMTLERKKWHKCKMCGNNAYDYQSRRRWSNVMIKKYNHQETIDAINEDKYNSKIFGKHRGFEYKKI